MGCGHNSCLVCISLSYLSPACVCTFQCLLSVALFQFVAPVFVFVFCNIELLAELVYTGFRSIDHRLSLTIDCPQCCSLGCFHGGGDAKAKPCRAIDATSDTLMPSTGT